jgi:hypothetical protein
MNVIAIERENRVKSGISTGIIVFCIMLLLWLCKLNIQMPAPMRQTAEMEVRMETQASGSSANEVSVPIEPAATQTSRSLMETPDEQAPKQQKTPDIVPLNPDDNSIEKMRQNREKARQEAEKAKQGNNDKGKEKGNGDDKSPGDGNDNGDHIGVSTTISGRSFKGGNTSADCHQAGKVVLEIQVLPNGKIIFLDVDPASNGSDCLVKAAKDMLKNSSFNESSASSSNGTITFIFKLN